MFFSLTSCCLDCIWWAAWAWTPGRWWRNCSSLQQAYASPCWKLYLQVYSENQKIASSIFFLLWNATEYFIFGAKLIFKQLLEHLRDILVATVNCWSYQIYNTYSHIHIPLDQVSLAVFTRQMFTGNVLCFYKFSLFFI